MKIHKHKIVCTLLAVGFIVGSFAQKQDKKYKESFKVNKDVVVEINATNTDIEVTTWNKNEVLVEAIIEIEGLTKEEAQKYLKNYKFEALGNSNKVRILSKGSGFYGFNDNFVFFNEKNFSFPEVVIPDLEFDFKLAEMENIVIPHLDFEEMFKGLEKLEFDFDKYNKDGDNYFFQWKDSVKNISIKSKKEWEKFKKTKEYKKWKKEMKANNEKLKKEMAKLKIEMKNVNSDVINKALEKAKVAVANIDMKKINKELAEVKKRMSKVKTNYFFESSGDLIVNDKKIKIKKKITIKVPKGATFDLNTRHCKVKLPNTTASGKVSYGAFYANNLQGGNLKIYYAPVTINRITAGNLSLNNVTDAKIASVANTTLNSNSGKLTIQEVFKDVNLESSFGELTINKLNPALKNFNLELKQSDAVIDAAFFVNNLKVHLKNQHAGMKEKNKKLNFSGNFSINTKDGYVTVNGKYSSLKLVK
ncbi:MAG: hypothetical protein JXQ93_09515 [Flavobacteriaceae bacterium]